MISRHSRDPLAIASVVAILGAGNTAAAAAGTVLHRHAIHGQRVNYPLALVAAGSGTQHEPVAVLDEGRVGAAIYELTLQGEEKGGKRTN